MSTQQFAHSQQRRSTRIDQVMPLVVQALSPSREPIQEQVSTLSISCHGCMYQSKHEFVQGDVVFVKSRPLNSATESSNRARVKWVQKLDDDTLGFRVAVELEVAGNIWGIPSPPSDWLPAQTASTSEAAASGRELRVVGRAEQPAMGTTEAGKTPITRTEPSVSGSPSVPPFAQLMAGLGEQIQVMASQAATTALVKEQNRALDQFRQLLRQEAVKTLQSVISSSKEEISRRALKELNDAHETGARTTYVRWMKKVEQDMEAARQQMSSQGTEMTQQIDGLAHNTVERVQRHLETTRSEAAERFVTRIREQFAPLFVDAKETFQTLATSQITLKKESQTMYAGLKAQLEGSAGSTLAKAQTEMDNSSAAVVERTHEALLKLSQSFEKIALENLQLLLASSESQITKLLEQKTAEISRTFTAGLEGYTRSYLEFIGKSISDISKHAPDPASEK